MKTHQRWICRAAVTAALAVAGVAKAVLIEEYFNNYGTTMVDLNTRGAAGNGWAAGWTGSASPEYAPRDVTQAYAKMTFVNANYNDYLNEFDADDGVARRQQGTSTGGWNAVSTRSFDSGLTGTVWISALALASGTKGEVMLWLDTPADDYIGMGRTTPGTDDNLQAEIRVNGTNNITDNTIFTNNVVYLLLAKLDINVSGTNDSLEFWVKAASDNISTPAALGTALYTVTGADIVGDSMDGIGFSADINGSRMDNIRISNDVNAFDQVTSIPEPATMSLLALGALLWRRRRAR